MALQPQAIPLRFPLGGVNENTRYSGDPQPVVVRPEHVLNCRPYDALERRARGGQRTGLAKWSAAQPSGGSDAIQLLDGFTEAIDPNQAASFGANQTTGITAAGSFTSTLKFRPQGDVLFVGDNTGTQSQLEAYAFTEAGGVGSLLDSVNTPWGSNEEFRGMAVSPDGNSVVVSIGSNPSEIYFITWDNAGQTFGTPALQTVATNSSIFAVDISPDGNYAAYGNSNSGVDTLRVVSYSSSSGFGAELDASADQGTSIGDVDWHPDGDYILCTTNLFPWDGSSLGTAISLPDGTAQHVRWFNAGNAYIEHDTGSDFSIRTFDATAGTIGGTDLEPSNTGTDGPIAIHPDDEAFALGLDTTSGDRCWIWTGTSVGDKFDPPPTLVGGGRNVGDQEWSPGGNWVVATYEDDSGDDVELAQYRFFPAETIVAGRRIRLMIVAGGSVYRSVDAGDSFVQPNSGGSVFSSSAAVRGASAFQDYFFVDGTSDYHWYDTSDDQVKDWGSSLTAGSLPAGTDDTTLGCTIIELWRGRIVLSGLREEPQNWFMSASGDRFDFDYSPSTTSATQAVAGNTSDAGEVGDVVNALIPFSDDLLFIGGDRTLWVMRGDPAAGGEIDNVSRNVGVVGPEAWTIDEAGTLWFFGNNGLYRIRPQSFAPELVSVNKLDKTFTEIDTAANEVRLAYDRIWQVVHIFINPLQQADSPVDHWVYDRRTDSFWRDQYPVEVGPRSIYLFDGPDPDDRAVILGGFDGYIREFSNAADDDDGTAIHSYIRLPMLHPALPAGQFQLLDHQLTLDRNGGANTQLDIYRGRTPEEAANASSAVFTRTLAAGRNLPARSRIRGNAIQFRLRSNTSGNTWAYEDGTAVIAATGRQRASL